MREEFLLWEGNPCCEGGVLVLRREFLRGGGSYCEEGVLVVRAESLL